MENGFAISAQVMSEFANVMFRNGGYDAKTVAGCVERMELIDTVVPQTSSLIKHALGIKALYQLHFYDAQIVAAAVEAGCSELWSEDMSVGQLYCGVLCVNPFVSDYHN